MQHCDCNCRDNYRVIANAMIFILKEANRMSANSDALGNALAALTTEVDAVKARVDALPPAPAEDVDAMLPGFTEQVNAAIASLQAIAKPV